MISFIRKYWTFGVNAWLYIVFWAGICSLPFLLVMMLVSNLLEGSGFLGPIILMSMMLIVSILFFPLFGYVLCKNVLRRLLAMAPEDIPAYVTPEGDSTYRMKNRVKKEETIEKEENNE